MTTLGWDERVKLAQQYAPYLVLFPEDKNLERPGKEVDQIGDYHPRGIGPLLERSTIYPGFWYSLKELNFAEIFNRTKRRPATLDNLAASHNPNDQLLLFGPSIPNPDRAWQAYFEILGDDRDRYPLTTYARVQTRLEALAACEREKIVIGAEEVGRPFFKPNTAREDDVSLQYWFCYYFDDWANVHEGDWEGISIFLQRNESGYEAIGAGYYAHETGTRRHWTEVERIGDHPLAFIAAGSHATYFQYVPEGFFTTIPALIIPILNVKLRINASSTRVDRVANEQAYPPLEPRVETLPDPIGPTNPNDPAWQHKKWLSFPGMWGTRIFSGLGYGGPTGPAYKGVKWHNPFTWVERNCGPDYLVY
jgi:hypothetical protein